MAANDPIVPSYDRRWSLGGAIGTMASYARGSQTIASVARTREKKTRPSRGRVVCVP